MTVKMKQTVQVIGNTLPKGARGKAGVAEGGSWEAIVAMRTTCLTNSSWQGLQDLPSQSKQFDFLTEPDRDLEALRIHLNQNQNETTRRVRKAQIWLIGAKRAPCFLI